MVKESRRESVRWTVDTDIEVANEHKLFGSSGSKREKRAKFVEKTADFGELIDEV